MSFLLRTNTSYTQGFTGLWHLHISTFSQGFLGGSDSKESTCSVGDLDSIPGVGRSPGEGNGYPLQYSCLENSIDRGAWWATVHSQRIGHGWGNFHVTHLYLTQGLNPGPPHCRQILCHPSHQGSPTFAR